MDASCVRVCYTVAYVVCYEDTQCGALCCLSSKAYTFLLLSGSHGRDRLRVNVSMFPDCSGVFICIRSMLACRDPPRHSGLFKPSGVCFRAHFDAVIDTVHAYRIPPYHRQRGPFCLTRGDDK